MAVRSYSPLRGATALFSLILTVGPASLVSGFLIGKMNQYKQFTVWGWVITVSGVAHFSSFDTDTPTWRWVLISMTAGLGLGLLFSSMSYAIQAALQHLGDRGSAAAMFSFLRSLGLMLGISITGVVFQNTFRSTLRSSSLLPTADATQLAKNALAAASRVWQMPESALRNGLVAAYVEGLRVSWWTITVIAISLGAATCVFTKDYTLD